MATKKDQFEERFFNQLDTNFKDLKSDIKETRSELRSNTKTTEEGFRIVNGRLKKVEDTVFGEPVLAKNLPSAWRDPAVLKIIGYVALAFLLLVAAVTQFDIGAIIK